MSLRMQGVLIALVAVLVLALCILVGYAGWWAWTFLKAMAAFG